MLQVPRAIKPDSLAEVAPKKCGIEKAQDRNQIRGTRTALKKRSGLGTGSLGFPKLVQLRPRPRINSVRVVMTRVAPGRIAISRRPSFSFQLKNLPSKPNQFHVTLRNIAFRYVLRFSLPLSFQAVDRSHLVSELHDNTPLMYRPTWASQSQQSKMRAIPAKQRFQKQSGFGRRLDWLFAPQKRFNNGRVIKN